MDQLMRGVKNGGQFVQGFAPDPSASVSQAVNAGANQTVSVPAGAIAARYQEVSGLDVTAQLVYTDAGGDPATETGGWVGPEDVIVFPAGVTVTGIKFSNGNAAAVTVRVRFM